MPETVRALFDLMDGEMCVSPGEAVVREETKCLTHMEETGCLRECFTHGQPIYHMLNLIERKYSTGVEGGGVWRGTYDVLRDGVLYKEELYKSLTEFAKAHYSSLDLVIPRELDGWTECCYLKEKDGKRWICRCFRAEKGARVCVL